MGMRPKTTSFTPFHRPSSAFKRPATAGRQRSADSTSSSRDGGSSLTTGGAIQGSRGLLSRRPNSASRPRSSRSSEKQMKIEMEEKLKNWNKPNTEYIQEQSSGEVNILKFGDDETDEITIPGLIKECLGCPNIDFLARSSIAVNIRNQGDQHDEAYSIDSESEEPELQEKNFETPKHEPKIIRKVSNTSLSSGYQSQSPSERKQLNALRG